MKVRAGILTLSDRSSRGEREDLSGPAVMEAFAPLGAAWVEVRVIPDDPEVLSSTLREWADAAGLDLILTTGGTGPAPRDRTPEGTRGVLDFEIPGIPEAMRDFGRTRTPFAALTRGLAGVRGRTVIINLPGSPKAVRENAEVLLPILPHLLEKVQGDPSECGSP